MSWGEQTPSAPWGPWPRLAVYWLRRATAWAFKASWGAAGSISQARARGRNSSQERVRSSPVPRWYRVTPSPWAAVSRASKKPGARGAAAWVVWPSSSFWERARAQGSRESSSHSSRKGGSSRRNLPMKDPSFYMFLVRFMQNLRNRPAYFGRRGAKMNYF